MHNINVINRDENNTGTNASFNSSCAQPPGLTPGDLPVFLLIDGKLPKAQAVGTKVEGKYPTVHNESNAAVYETRQFVRSKLPILLVSCPDIQEFVLAISRPSCVLRPAIFPLISYLVCF